MSMTTDAAREKAKGLIAIALDERNKEEKERIAAAFNALAIIERHGLIESPLAGLIDPETREMIDSGEKFIRGAKKIYDRFQGRSGGGGRRRRG